MNNKSRITSILKTPTLDSSITGIPSFNLSDLDHASDFDFPLPNGLRLGHLAEKIVSILIKSSLNYKVLYESIQLFENERTIGELDFILLNQNTQQLLHVELAYKFYLYDPGISSETINNWIGPNRNDLLKEKLDKTKSRQFPLLYHKAAKSELDQLDINEISQKLCLLISLFVPYDAEIQLPPGYRQAVIGYYLNLETFLGLDHAGKSFYLPHKREWGIDPSENENWKNDGEVHDQIRKSIDEKRSLLCWQKDEDSYSAFFIVWW